MKAWLLPLVILLRRSAASECEVSPWAGWSQCFGDCQYGQQVRNRDVLKPPLPEMMSRGAPLVRICPHLYETRFCAPIHCVAATTTMPNRLRHRWHASTKVFRSWPSTKAVSVEEKNPNLFGDERNNGENNLFDGLYPTLIVQDITKSRPIIEESSPLPLPTPSSVPDPVISLQHRYRNRVEPQEHFTLRGTSPRAHLPSLQDHLQMFAQLKAKEHSETINQKKKEKKDEEYKKYFGWINNTSSSSSSTSTSTTTSTTHTPPTTTVDQTRLESAVAFKPNGSTTSDKQQSFPSTASPDPFNEETFEDITAATKAPNMKEVMIIMQTTIATPKETAITTTTEAGVLSTTRGMWLRDPHFVPNTRQHASEITKQLYLTGQIKQADRAVPEDRNVKHDDCLENPRCCMIVRDVCPDGTEPNYVKRYYRPRDSKECVPYRYPRCDKGTEMGEQPIQFSQNCEDLCFPTKEKSISPLFVLSSEV